MTDEVAPDGAQPSSAPVVSIVTVYYNRETQVGESVASLLAQTYSHLEIILVDDGSRDGTLAALRAFDDPRVKVVSLRNGGFTAAINAGIRASKGAYVAIHGSGDISLPDRIAEQAAVLDAHPEVGVVGCWVEDDVEGGGTRIVKPPEGLPFGETLLKRNFFSHGEVMFRRDLFDRVGGYREFFRFSQDRDLWLRMAVHAGYAIVPKLLYRRKRLADGVSTNIDRLTLQYYCNSFALYCARNRDADGRDPLDRLGPAAALLRERQPVLASRLVWLGAGQMTRGNVAQGWPLVQRATREDRTLPVMLAYGLASLHRCPPLWKWLAKPLLSYRIARFK